jgi:hypothetical protein
VRSEYGALLVTKGKEKEKVERADSVTLSAASSRK